MDLISEKLHTISMNSHFEQIKEDGLNNEKFYVSKETISKNATCLLREVD